MRESSILTREECITLLQAVHDRISEDYDTGMLPWRLADSELAARLHAAEGELDRLGRTGPTEDGFRGALSRYEAMLREVCRQPTTAGGPGAELLKLEARAKKGGQFEQQLLAAAKRLAGASS